jgi:hypothetical protein
VESPSELGNLSSVCVRSSKWWLIEQQLPVHLGGDSLTLTVAAK